MTFVYIKNLKSIPKKSPRMSEFRYKNKWIKIQGNMQKLIIFLYTSSEYIETEIKIQCYIILL